MSLFTMFREFEQIEIKDDTSTLSIAFRSLSYAESSEVIDIVTEERIKAREVIDTPKRKDMLLTEIKTWPQTVLIDRIIVVERPTAVSVVDLAPIDEEVRDEEGRRKAEKVALERWEAERRTQLAGTETIELHRLMIERLVLGEITARANERYTRECLIRMVVDPETKAPLLSGDPDTETYIGKLTPGARMKLVEHWQAFVLKLGMKQLRSAAKSPDFFGSGGSPKSPDGSPGGTDERSLTSPLTLSSSTPSE